MGAKHKAGLITTGSASRWTKADLKLLITKLKEGLSLEQIVKDHLPGKSVRSCRDRARPFLWTGQLPESCLQTSTPGKRRGRPRTRHLPSPEPKASSSKHQLRDKRGRYACQSGSPPDNHARMVGDRENDVRETDTDSLPDDDSNYIVSETEDEESATEVGPARDAAIQSDASPSDTGPRAPDSSISINDGRQINQVSSIETGVPDLQGVKDLCKETKNFNREISTANGDDVANMGEWLMKFGGLESRHIEWAFRYRTLMQEHTDHASPGLSQGRILHLWSWISLCAPVAYHKRLWAFSCMQKRSDFFAMECVNAAKEIVLIVERYLAKPSVGITRDLSHALCFARKVLSDHALYRESPKATIFEKISQLLAAIEQRSNSAIPANSMTLEKEHGEDQQAAAALRAPYPSSVHLPSVVTSDSRAPNEESPYNGSRIDQSDKSPDNHIIRPSPVQHAANLPTVDNTSGDLQQKSDAPFPDIASYDPYDASFEVRVHVLLSSEIPFDCIP
ncbi:uncharacterized protein Z519_09142 [Cladophialophora bantiana CBS 173.52]|uniref:Uncharacterized protein n=1 Tax=Cladophialophora bantiana (strain ATCC 10958 / CBS 173.52 / CDC B-1940 / NIH 8579) TaxID=1442370 RepID=A0A0D2EKJ0_CLAB1|nr:uncharacterized protein Z519_09142 [Cladophialophora bantiana CBS 173.52]KIW90496.1 hypothetical protein Z519_09142 [Cladophialophora bantiana CBS 173.52]